MGIIGGMRTILFALLMAALPAAAEDLVSGQWTYRMDSPMGETKAEMTLKAEGDKVTGKIVFEGSRTLEITEGKLEGGALTFTIKRERPSGGSMTYRMTGKVEGKAIKGTATADEMSNGGEMAWSASRN
jgi:hypothetical protein